MTKSTHKQKHITDFFQNEVRSFSIYDCQRSLPSGIDGFKPAMRKIIYGMNKKFANQEIKLSLAAAGIQECSAYHHGSLEGTVVNMAQRFPGANNVPFLDDIGQFGSRINPVAAASRYIFTKLNDSFRQLFLKADDGILVHQEDDGMSIEPEYYLPIIPTVLLNGSDGMGTGFACKILNYNPLHLIEACETVIKRGKLSNDLTPWYSNFHGTIEKIGTQTVITGCYSIENSTTLKITELPIGTFTQKYREVLNDLEDAGAVKNYVDNSTEERTEFVVTCPRDTLKKSPEEILKLFKLVSRDTENITVWTETGRLRKFETAAELVEWFVKFRLTKYEARRLHLIDQHNSTLSNLQQRRKFIEYYLAHTEWFSKSTKAQIVEKLTELGYTIIDELLAIRLYNLTHDQICELDKKIEDEVSSIRELKITDNKTLYLTDLKQAKQYFKSLKMF